MVGTVSDVIGQVGSMYGKDLHVYTHSLHLGKGCPLESLMTSTKIVMIDIVITPWEVSGPKQIVDFILQREPLTKGGLIYYDINHGIVQKRVASKKDLDLNNLQLKTAVKLFKTLKYEIMYHTPTHLRQWTTNIKMLWLFYEQVAADVRSSTCLICQEDFVDSDKVFHTPGCKCKPNGSTFHVHCCLKMIIARLNHLNSAFSGKGELDGSDFKCPYGCGDHLLLNNATEDWFKIEPPSLKCNEKTVSFLTKRGFNNLMRGFAFIPNEA